MDSLPNESERKPRVVRFHGVDVTIPDLPDSPTERKRLVDELSLKVARLFLEFFREHPPEGMAAPDPAPPPPARPLTEAEVRALPRYRPFGRKGKAADGR